MIINATSSVTQGVASTRLTDTPNQDLARTETSARQTSTNESVQELSSTQDRAPVSTQVVTEARVTSEVDDSRGNLVDTFA